MRGKEGLQVSCRVAILDKREELKLGLDAARAEDDKSLAGILPGFQCWDDVVKERSLEFAGLISSLPQLAC